MCTLCHVVFALPLGVIDRIFSAIVSCTGHILYYLLWKKKFYDSRGRSRHIRQKMHMSIERNHFDFAGALQYWKKNMSMHMEETQLLVILMKPSDNYENNLLNFLFRCIYLVDCINSCISLTVSFLLIRHHCSLTASHFLYHPFPLIL